jgi:signal transduction histidine kinase
MTTHPTIRILIIDDDDDDRAILGDLLAAQGHTAVPASSGAEGLRLARELIPDLIILDVMMPKLDGFAVGAQLRTDPITAEVPIIMITSLDDRQSRLRGIAAGADEFLTKPVDTAELRVRVQAIARINRYRRLLDERARAEREITQLNAALEQRVADRTAALTEANDRLRELNAFKDSLLATTSHDLRSPLGAIQNLAELLLDEHDPCDDARHIAQHIYDTAHHLIAMVNNMLDLSKLEAGKVELERMDLRVSDVARQSLATLQASAQAKMITAKLRIEPDEPQVSANPIKLSQIMNNLLSNAIKFTSAGGHVTVTVGPEPSGTCLRVADTGLGIPPDTLPRLFEKFYQIHAVGTAGEQGSGLGLAIVRQLVELHGGAIEVASEVQRGSTFSVHLPAGAKSAQGAHRCQGT